MTTLVKNLEVFNFRSCINTKICIDTYTALIGYNNAGKSNIISALKFLIDPSSVKSFPLSGNINNSSEEIIVTCELHNINEVSLSILDPTHATKIRPFITNNILKIRKKSFLDKNKQKFQIQLFNGNTWEDNPAGIENSIIELFPSLIHIEAMSDAVEDSTKSKTTTSIGKLLALISEEIINEHKASFEQSILNLKNLIEYNGESRITALSDIDTGINNILNQIFPNISVKVDFSTPDITEILKSGTLKIFENGNDLRDFSGFGHGAQRSIQIALIRYLADIKKNPLHTKTTMICIDEPELFLHPSSINIIRESLIKLSENGYQIIFSTHSASLLSASKAMDAIQIYKTNNGTQARHPLNQALRLEDYAPQLKKVFELNNASHIFFSEKILLVEGATEDSILSLVYEKILLKSFNLSNLAIIPLHGKDNLAKTYKLLKNMGFRVKILTDLDYIGCCKKNDFVNSENEDFFESFRSKIENLKEEEKSQLRLETSQYRCLKSLGSIGAKKYKSMIEIDQSFIGIISSIHDNLKTNYDIFIWKEGDIDTIFGFEGKSESVWQDFREKIIVEGKEVQNEVVHYESLCEMINWLDN